MNIRAIVAARRVKNPNHVEIIDDFDTVDLSAIPIDTHPAEPSDDDDLHPWAAWTEDEEPELEWQSACQNCSIDRWCSRHAYRAYKKRKVRAFRRRRAELAQRVRR